MFYVILTIVILVVFGTIFAAPKQPKQTGGYQDANTVIESITALDTLRGQVENLRSTIESIAPNLPTQGNAINEITSTLNTFQTDFFGVLDNMASNVETQLS